MSNSIRNSREAQVRLSDAMQSYRVAFERVEALVREGSRSGKLPGWVFAVDRLTDEQVLQLPAVLQAAELQRRRERVALHCVAELIALEQVPGVGWAPPEPLQDPQADRAGLLEGEPDSASRADLDRFIAIVDFARRHGVIYTDGTFRVVEQHEPQS